MTTEIKLIENKQEQCYRVTVNGKDAYSPFTWINFDEMLEMRRLAKAAAFDELCTAQMDGKITVSYLSF